MNAIDDTAPILQLTQQRFSDRRFFGRIYRRLPNGPSMAEGT